MNQTISTSTVAVIVSFNPDLALLRKMLGSLVVQCPAVIVDNGSSQSILNDLKELVQDRDSVELITLQDNMGIAHAQNTAIQHITDNYSTVKYVLTLDHDSIPTDNMISCLEKTFEAFEKHGDRVAALGPVLYDPRDNKFLKFQKMKFFFPGKIDPKNITSENPAVEVDGLNSSGSLISTRAFRVIGKFDSDLFIDHVETDWCFRAKAKGFKLFATNKTMLTHFMGDDVCYYWFLRKKSMPYRSPSRHYYLARNSILLQKRGYIPIAWKASNILKLCFTYIYFGFFCKDGIQQRKCIQRGIHDGMKDITGRFAHNL